MAKEDFCYTHYDGDEARDMAHMNRLERGAYTDLRLAQRKFGRLSLDRIKKILSKDFEATWDSIEAVLHQDEDGMYYIEWLENSIQKMRRHSKKQKTNVSKRFGNTNCIPNEDLVIPKDDLVYPLENGNGDEEEKEEGGMGETKIIPQMFAVWRKENPAYRPVQEDDFTGLRKIAQFISGRKGIEHIVNGDLQNLLDTWGRWCKHIRGSTMQNDSLLTISKFKLQKIHNEISNGKQHGKIGQDRSHKPVITGTANGAGKL